MTKFQEYVLRKIFSKVVRQGYQWFNIRKVYSLLREAVEQEFTEANTITKMAYLYDQWIADVDNAHSEISREIRLEVQSTNERKKL